jgi:apolipoprotein N-acyltransferase
MRNAPSRQRLDANVSAEDPAYEAYAYSPFWRLVGAATFAVSRAGLVVMLLAILHSRIAVTPLEVIRTFVLLFVMPALAARVIARGMAARVELGDGDVTIERPGVRVDVPLSAVAGVAPWRVPLPAPGFALVLGSQRRVRPGIASHDPDPLLRALAGRGGTRAATAVDHPTIVYARARAAWGRWRWTHLAARFPLFALGPTLLLFNVHQHIAYGGFFGQYYLMGLRPYVLTFAVYWATVTIYHVLYASVWRGLAEPICLVAAAVAPSRAARVRRAAEFAIRGVYYAGVPALLVLRFAPW